MGMMWMWYSNWALLSPLEVLNSPGTSYVRLGFALHH
jgi:hypothetical protein